MKTYPASPVPESGYIMDITPRVNSPEGEASSMRSVDGINIMMRSTELSYKALTQGQRDALLRFCEEHGGMITFLWQPIGDALPSLWRATRWVEGPTEIGVFEMSVSVQQEFDIYADMPV